MLTVESYLASVGEDITRLDASYSSVFGLLSDAVREASPWVPAFVMQKSVPDIKRLRRLAVQLLAVCYISERNSQGA